MLQIADRSQGIAQRLPDMRIARMFFYELGQVGKQLIDQFAAADQVIICTQRLRELPLLGIGAGSDQERVDGWGRKRFFGRVGLQGFLPGRQAAVSKKRGDRSFLDFFVRA